MNQSIKIKLFMEIKEFIYTHKDMFDTLNYNNVDGLIHNNL